MTLNLDAVVLGILAIVAFFIHTRTTGDTIKRLLSSVESLTAKVMARTLPEMTQHIAVQSQAEINKIAVENMTKVDPKANFDEPNNEGETVL